MYAVQQIHHEQLHHKALEIAGEYLRYEARLIGVLQELDRAKTFLHFEQPSLFAYATRCLKLSEHVALSLIGIARKSMQVPELKAAIEEKKINVGNARRIAPILTPENKMQWLESAARLSQGKLDQELARAFPERAAPAKIKYKTETLARIELDVPAPALDLLKRAQEILSQRRQKHVDVAHALETVLAEFVERHDPVKKAERAKLRKVRPPQDVEKLHVLKRVRADAGLKHAIVRRDQSRCAWVGPDGLRCAARQWLDVHHLRPVSLGGTNDPRNLRTLCGAHHRMVHGQEIAHGPVAHGQSAH